MTPTPLPAILAVLLALPIPALAQQASPASRYSITPSDGGFVRLDTETGTVSHCLKRDGTWLCEPAEEHQKTNGRIADLGAAVQALSARLERVENALADLSRQVMEGSTERAAPAETDRAAEAPAKPGAGDDDGAAGAEPNFAARLVGPLVTVVGNLKRGLAGGE